MTVTNLMMTDATVNANSKMGGTAEFSPTLRIRVTALRQLDLRIVEMGKWRATRHVMMGSHSRTTMAAVLIARLSKDGGAKD